MSEDTPECAKLHHLKKYFLPEHVVLARGAKQGGLGGSQPP